MSAPLKAYTTFDNYLVFAEKTIIVCLDYCFTHFFLHFFGKKYTKSICRYSFCKAI